MMRRQWIHCLKCFGSYTYICTGFCAKIWGFVKKCNIAIICPKYRKKRDLSYLNASELEQVDYCAFFFLSVFHRVYFCCQLSSEDIFLIRMQFQWSALIFSWKHINEDQHSSICCQQNYFCKYHNLVWYVKNCRHRCNR